MSQRAVVPLRHQVQSEQRSLASTIFGVVGLLFAALYLFLFLKVVPSRATGFTAVAVVISGLFAAGGVGLILQTRWGRRVAAAAAIVMLVACGALILLLVASAAYLHGIYDGIGEAGAAFGILAAVLAIELVGLLPALQLAHLWRRRRAAQERA